MSRTYLLVFKDGKVDREVEYANAWGGAARVWNALFDAYIPKKHEFDSWLLTNNGNDRRLWDLAVREDLPLFERAVHAFTFDRFYVRGEHFGRLAADLRAFAAKYPCNSKDHLPAWADWLDANNGVEAVGLHATSVSENPWRRTKTCQHCWQETDEAEPVPLSEGTEVYDWLEGGAS